MMRIHVENIDGMGVWVDMEGIGVEAVLDDVIQELSQDGERDVFITDAENIPFDVSENDNVYDVLYMIEDIQDVNEEMPEAVKEIYDVVDDVEEATEIIKEGSFTYWEVPANIHMTIEEFIGHERACIFGIVDELKKMNVDEFFDYETYGQRIMEDSMFYKISRTKAIEVYE